MSALELFLRGDGKECSSKLFESINFVHRCSFVRKLSFRYQVAFTLVYATVPNATLHLKIPNICLCTMTSVHGVIVHKWTMEAKMETS